LNLIKSENELKEKLQNEVTKVKEKLENFLSESNRLIKMNEKLNKSIEKIQKEEKNFLKVLNYVSNINKNKNKKEMSLLIQEPIKNILKYLLSLIIIILNLKNITLTAFLFQKILKLRT